MGRERTSWRLGCCAPHAPHKPSTAATHQPNTSQLGGVCLSARGRAVPAAWRRSGGAGGMRRCPTLHCNTLRCPPLHAKPRGVQTDRGLRAGSSLPGPPDRRAAARTPRWHSSKGSLPAATSSAAGHSAAATAGEPLSTRSTRLPARLRALRAWQGKRRQGLRGHAVHSSQPCSPAAAHSVTARPPASAHLAGRSVARKRPLSISGSSSA